MEKLNRTFRRLLRSYNIGSLRAHSEAIYGVWADFRLAYLNPGWFRFSEENGGEPCISTEWGLGRSILDSIPWQLRELYEERYHDCLNLNEVWLHEYECSSDTTYRRYHQVVYPLGQREGLLVVNSLFVENPHDPVERPPRKPEKSVYLNQEGLICQCAHCRRVKNFHESERWDWVPQWVRQFPPATSHSVCPTCFSFYYRPLTKPPRRKK